MTYKAILFDLDDTLYDLRSYWRGRLHEALNSVLSSYPHFDRDQLVRQAIAEKVYIEKLPTFLRAQGVDDEALIASAQEEFRREWFERLELYDDAVHTLQALRPRYKLGLVTNGPSRTQRPKIEQFRLIDYLDLLIVSEEVGVAKPDPAIFQIAMEQLGVAPHQTLFVGDSLEFDLRGATAAGLPFVWMNPRHEQLPPELPAPLTTIERLHELPALLAASTNS
ncbi:MAG: HAD family hydrolase [Kouleothrix sp.]|nr:HAD family hydrolase [Kouleothrix sp.]